jgi:iron complex outermembrane receptor protein
MNRQYDVAGEEALSPPVDQNGLAFFALEEIDFDRVKFQFGGRVETQRYLPTFAERGHEHEEEGEEHEGEEEEHERGEVADAVDRRFTGASAAAGIHVGLWQGGAFVANYAHSYRAPSLEELYNFGPHVGNLAFEIGDPSLEAERGNGVDVSLRHGEGRIRGDLNLFYYDFYNFVFPFATGEEEDGLREIQYTQRDARFRGGEANVNFGLHRDFWLNLGADYVEARETTGNTPLPRIPPLRGRIGFDYNRSGFQFSPELILASQQQQTFTGETRTPGYAVVNLAASYTYAQRHSAHQFSVNVFNLGDRLYRNHSSFIKDLAPEIGRGVRFTYMVRFF